jgi:hypothetical protein
LKARCSAEPVAPTVFGSRGRLFFWFDFEHPILGHHSVELLLPLLRHTGRQGRDVPSTRKLVDDAFGANGEDTAVFLDALRADGGILGEWLAEDASGPIRNNEMATA